MRQTMRITGAVLVGAGVLGLAWALLVWQWQDPITALYTTYEQHQLSESFDKTFASYHVPALPVATSSHKPVDLKAEQRAIALESARYRKTLKVGQALGRLNVPRLGLSIIVVTGTKLPGEGQLIYIAGHRTTYLAPFAHIDALQHGDPVKLVLPYATFLYRVTGHVIVQANDVARLKSRGYEQVALQACHPRFFATHRYIVYARPVEVIPRKGTPYLVSTTGHLSPA